MTHSLRAPERKPDWKAHFDWLRKPPGKQATDLLAQFEEDRRRQRAREQALGNLK
ncbi:MAG TPA: hypothetical protein VN829_23105 [Dongiaceae bacterium]|nr:hypothetical protein [Dongiaceae bacterium]